MALTTEQRSTFQAWLDAEWEKLYWPDSVSAEAVEALALAAFEEGIRVANLSEEIRYDAQYRRRFLGGARLVERERRETPGRTTSTPGVSS